MKTQTRFWVSSVNKAVFVAADYYNVTYNGKKKSELVKKTFKNVFLMPP